MGAQCATERCEASNCLEQQVDAAASQEGPPEDGRVLLDDKPAPSTGIGAISTVEQHPVLLTSAARYPDEFGDKKPAAAGFLGTVSIADARPGGVIAKPQVPGAVFVKAGDPVVAPRAVPPGEHAQQIPPGQPQVFVMTIAKLGLDEKLGLDVRHDDGMLEVATIFPDGAIERVNKLAKSRIPMGHFLQLGDIILKVNDVEGDDNAMVEECKSSSALTLLVERCERREQP